MLSPRFLLELHCHTIASMDGMMSYDSLARISTEVGLSGLAITDHDTIEGALAMRELVRERGLALQIIVGEEKTLADGSHFIGLFLEKPIVSGDLAGAIAEIHAQGGLCLIPHPFRRKDGLLRAGLEPLKLLEGKPAAFEIFNAKCSAVENRLAGDLLRVTSLAPFGGSDAHYESDLGEAMNVIEWAGDLRSSVEQMFERKRPFQILGKPQRIGDGERAYAPLYYRVKKYVRLPKPLVPVARECYRRYRNWKYGVGSKSLREVYRHA